MALKRSKKPIRQITEISIGAFPPRVRVIRYAAGQTSFDFLRKQLADDETLVDEHEGDSFPQEPRDQGPAQ